MNREIKYKLFRNLITLSCKLPGTGCNELLLLYFKLGIESSDKNFFQGIRK